MFVIVNPNGVPSHPFIATSFTTLLTYIETSNLSDQTTVYVNIVSPDNDSCGKYDMILHHVQDHVSRIRYVQGYIIKESDAPIRFYADIKHTKTKYDITGFFNPDQLVNGYISLESDRPVTVLDNDDQLKVILDEFFSIPSTPLMSPVIQQRKSAAAPQRKLPLHVVAAGM
jgi:hypothetical protein